MANYLTEKNALGDVKDGVLKVFIQWCPEDRDLSDNKNWSDLACDECNIGIFKAREESLSDIPIEPVKN